MFARVQILNYSSKMFLAWGDELENDRRVTISLKIGMSPTKSFFVVAFDKFYKTFLDHSAHCSHRYIAAYLQTREY
jgi:hypothetical protein